ncbi:8704_t:CDS:1, partial [Funneliformis caledonium]
MTIEEVRQVLQKVDKKLNEVKVALKVFNKGKSKGKLLTELRKRPLNK